LFREELLQVCKRLGLRGAFNSLLGNLLDLLVGGFELLGQLRTLVAQILVHLFQSLGARRKDVAFTIEFLAQQFLAVLGFHFSVGLPPL